MVDARRRGAAIVAAYYDASIPAWLINPPTPVLTSLDPTSIEVGAVPTVVTLTGTGFTPRSTVWADEEEQLTSYVSPTTLRYDAEADLEGSQTITVRNTAELVSNAIELDVTGEPAAPPAAPTGVTAGTPGAFEPPGAQVPATIGDLRALAIGAGAAWAEGQHVVIGSGNVHWDGADWAMGVAPPEEPPL